MKFSPQIIVGLAFIVLGLVFVIGGFILKLNHYSEGWITGNNIIILGMMIELIGLFAAVSAYTKSLKK